MNLPNKLTLLRIASVPVIVIVYLGLSPTIGILNPSTQLSLRDVLVCLLFIASAVTDFFDGHIARKHHLITTFGQFIDPLADKLLVNTMLILLVFTRQANVLAVLLMTGRDLFVDGLRLVASANGKVVSAGIFGKAKTVAQMIALVGLLLRLPMASLLLWVATLLSLFSGVIYFLKLKNYVLESL